MHPLSTSPSDLPLSTEKRYAHPSAATLTAAQAAQWAKSVPRVEKVLHNGKPIDVFNLRQRFAILSPSYGFQVTEYYLGSYVACLQVTAAYRVPDGSIQELPIIDQRLNVPNDSHIDRARNTLTNMWVNEDATDLAYWWDVDIPLPPQFLMRLFSHLVTGKDFVCGLYAMKDIVPRFVANVSVRPDHNDPLIEILDGATGSMAWTRRVTDRLREHPDCKPYLCAANSPHPGQIHYAYFSSGVYGKTVSLPKSDLQSRRASDLQTPPRSRADHATSESSAPQAPSVSSVPSVPLVPSSETIEVGQWLSEDWKVCRMWQDLGEKVYADRRVRLQHFGGLLYPPTAESVGLATETWLKNGHPQVPHEKLRHALENYKVVPLETPAAELKSAA